jgi:hypothetical protein
MTKKDPVDLGTVALRELEIVETFVLFMRGGTDMPRGVTIHSHMGRRCWQIGAADGHVEITGEPATFTDAVQVPAQFVRSALQLVQRGDPVQLTYHDHSITAAAPIGSVTLPARPGTAIESPVRHAPSVRASLPIRNLFHAFEAGSDLPLEAMATMFEDDEGFPDTVVTIGDGRIDCTTNWVRHRAGILRSSTPACTEMAGTVQVSAPALNNLTNQRLTVGNPEAVVSCDPVAGQWLVIAAEQWTVALKTRPSPAQRLFKETLAWTRKGNRHVVSDDRGSIATDDRGTAVRIMILAGTADAPPVARCTSIVLRDAEETQDLLAEINAFNRTLTTSRVWVDRGMVVVGSDVEMKTFNAAYFEHHFANVANDARRLAGILAPLAVTFGG